jgi:hypothetical protein
MLLSVVSLNFIHNLGIFKSMILVLSATQRPVRGALSKEFLVVNNSNYDDVMYMYDTT